MSYRDLSREELEAELALRDKQLCESELMRMGLQANSDRLAQIVRTTPVGICVTDEGGFIEQVNPAWCQLLGYRAEELLGRHFTMIFPDQQRDHRTRIHDQFFSHNSTYRGEWNLVSKPGHEMTVLVDSARILGADERPKKVTYIIDISEKKSFEAQLRESNRQLEELARTDSLTGLLNHRTAIEELISEMRRSKRSQDPLSIMLLDLDRFKQVNDTQGHLIGDMVLQVTANCINSSIRSIDTAGRYGGEEFLVILPGSDLESARGVAERIRQKLEAHRFKQGFSVTTSIGLGKFSGGSAQELLDQADQNLYRAKDAGRNQVVG